MSGYTDVTLINCNRSASVEARSGNDSNPAIFQNPLQQSIKLDVGDKVSVERAFISEVGAGNPSTIEFKGNNKGKTNVATYTEMAKTEFFTKKSTTYDPNYRLGGYRVVTTTEKTDATADLRDNLAPLIYGYYITASEYPNYIQQPRRFAQSQDTRGSTLLAQTFYTSSDSSTSGACDFTIDEQNFVSHDWAKRVKAGSGFLYRQKVKNERYTLFIKDKIVYARGDNNELDTQALEMFPQISMNGIISEGKYYRVRERLDLEVNKGFNTPSAVAEQLTEQLTDTQPPEIFSILDGDGIERNITKILESSTYKPINAQNYYNYNSATYADYRNAGLINAGNLTQNIVDYMSQFGYIAVKRPEIFEAGRSMGDALSFQPARVTTQATIGTTATFNGWEGFKIFNTIPNTTPPTRSGTNIILNCEYTEDNLKKIREFLDTQALYPELWESLEDSVDYKASELIVGKPYPTIENSRFFNMNKFTEQTGAGHAENQNTFGNDDFTAGGNNGTANKASGAIFFAYDDTQREKFILPDDYELTDGYMYGFARPHEYIDNLLGKRFLILIEPSEVGGIPVSFFTNTGYVGGSSVIENNRRIGYDYHATAFSTCIITPYSGYGISDIGTTVNESNPISTSNITSTSPNLRDSISSANRTDLSPYYSMTYIGANNPLIDYNTTNNRFEIKRLHTANNVGNKLRAGTQATSVNNDSRFPPIGSQEIRIVPADINQDSGATVYKINPRPPQFGYSPTFKPYFMNNAAFRGTAYPFNPNEVHSGAKSNSQLFPSNNLNIEPYEIFDSHGGIYIDDWGYSQDNWENNLWDILGYDYDVVNAPPSATNVLTKRIDNSNRNFLYRTTTNAETVSTDSKVYIANEFNAKQYYTSLPYPNNINNLTTGAGTGADQFKFVFPNSIGQPLSVYPEIVVETESLAIRATDLQKSVLKPYYAVRSSILAGYSAVGGNPTGANLPIVSIVDKYSAQGDYFFGNPSDLVFTITKPTQISDITTSIHDPDGEYSNVDLTSSVIYKVEKIKQADTTIIEDIMEQAKQDKK